MTDEEYERMKNTPETQTLLGNFEWKDLPKDYNHPTNQKLRALYGLPVYVQQYDDLKKRPKQAETIGIVENHLDHVERVALSLLRNNQEQWGGVLTLDLFTGHDRRDLWRAITGVEDPRDPLQIHDWAVENEHQLEGHSWGNVSIELTHPDYETPWMLHGEDWIEARMSMLVKRQELEQARVFFQNGADFIREGVDLEYVLRYAESGLKRRMMAAGRFKDVPVYTSEMAKGLPVTQSLVRGVLYPKGMSVIAGPAGVGKSWLGLELLRGLAGEMFWMGFKCDAPQNVAYLCLEMPTNELALRVLMLGDLQNERLRILGSERAGSFDILNASDQASLKTFIAVHEIDVLVVDSFRKAHGADENDSTEMDAALKGFSDLGCAVLLLHHVDKAKGLARGSTSIGGAVDAVLTCTKEGDDVVRVDWEKPPRFESSPGSFRYQLIYHSGTNRMEIRKL